MINRLLDLKEDIWKSIWKPYRLDSTYEMLSNSSCMLLACYILLIPGIRFRASKVCLYIYFVYTYFDGVLRTLWNRYYRYTGYRYYRCSSNIKYENQFLRSKIHTQNRKIPLLIENRFLNPKNRISLSEIDS